MNSDRKLALLVAAAVLVGFGIIAAFSTMAGRSAPASTTAQDGVGGLEGLLATAPGPAAADATQPAMQSSISAGTPEEAEAFHVEPGVDYLARGLEAYRARNWEHAVAYLFAEAEARPDRGWTQYLLGLSLWKAGRLDEAAEAMRRSAELDATSIKTLVNLARIENDRGAFDEALEAARTALGLWPGDPEALFLEGRSLRNLGDRAGAVDSLRRSVETEPGNGYAWNLLGLTLLEVGDDPAAAEALERAAGLAPEVAYIQNNLGMALERTGRREEAIAAYGRAASLDPSHAHAAANLTRLEGLPRPPSDPREEGLALAQGPDQPTAGPEGDPEHPAAGAELASDAPAPADGGTR